MKSTKLLCDRQQRAEATEGGSFPGPKVHTNIQEDGVYMDPGMEDKKDSRGKTMHPRVERIILHQRRAAATRAPCSTCDADDHGDRVYNGSPLTEEIPVRPETRSIASTHGWEQDENPHTESPPDNPQDSRFVGPDDQPGGIPGMLLQPETRPISHDQLVIEVKGIYAGLVMVEAKCIDIDEKVSAAAATEKDLPKRTQLKNDQYQSLIALHKQLLHEHHDFLLASQHPAASPALSRLAAKYSMPARMWRHGIHAFLEVLRHKLPDSLEHMLAFIYIVYSMMAQLYETVPTFEDTWIECLGDLGRYRTAIEDDEPRDHEVWSNVARFWYNKAADKSPSVGRLYHHLAILARPCSLEQLSLYTRSLTCVTALESARESILTLFSPILSGRYTTEPQPSSLESVFIKAHEKVFDGSPELIEWSNYFEDYFSKIISKLKEIEDYFSKITSKFREKDFYIAFSNIAAIFEYGSLRNGMSSGTIRRGYEEIHRGFDGSEPPNATGAQDESSTKHQLINAFPDVLRSALDKISHWKMRSTSYRKASGSIRWSSVRAAYKIRSSLALTLTTCTNFVVPTTARTIPRNSSNGESTGSFTAAAVPLAYWPYFSFVIVTLLVAQYLAQRKDAIFVWGCMMTIWAFGWWTIRADSSTTLQISGV